MSLIFWDTNLFIYFLEGSGQSAHFTKAIRERMRLRGDQICTSALTLGEILVKPLEAKDFHLQRKYEEMLRSQTRVIDFDAAVARRFAEIRTDRSIESPDAIQLACAGHAEADILITNDDHLSNKAVRGINFIVSLEKAYRFFV